MQTDEDRPEHFARHEQMPDVPAAEGPRSLPAVRGRVAGGAITAGLDGKGIGRELGVAEADLPSPRESVRVAAVACGQHAVEHVYPGPHGGDDVALVTHP